MKRAGYSIKINGKSFAVTVSETTQGEAPVVTPAPTQTAVFVAQTAPAPKIAVGNATKVVAPMPGTVLSVKKDAVPVKKGDAILVLEAMKMENEIAAPCDGNVSVLVSVGSKVNSGDALAVIQ